MHFFTLFDWLCRVVASAAVVLGVIQSGVQRRCQHQLAAHKTEASNAVSRDKNRRGNGSDGICFTSPALSLATVSKGESASERDGNLSQLLLSGSSATLFSLETFQWLHKLLRVWKILQTVSFFYTIFKRVYDVSLPGFTVCQNAVKG